MSGDIATLGLAVDSRKVVTAEKDLKGFSNAAIQAELAARKVAAANEKVAASAGMASSGVGYATRYLKEFIIGAVAAGGAIFGTAVLIKNFISNTIDAEENLAQLNARLASTKHAAGLSSDELLRLATSLQSLTTYEDDAIISSEALLLSFHHIGRNVFPEAQKQILNLATGMKGDLLGATLQLGKALDNPIEGLTALGRAGVKFSDAQTDSIKAMIKTGDVAGAQTIILKELEKQFGDSALAARHTLGGALKALGNAWGNLFEVSGSGSQKMAAAIEQLIKKFEEPRTIKAINNIGTAVFVALTWATEEIVKFVENVQTIGGQFSAAAVWIETTWEDISIAATRVSKEIDGAFALGADLMVASFNTAKDLIILTVNELPGAFQLAAASAGKYLIDGIANAAQKVAEAVNYVIEGLNSLSPESLALPTISLAPFENFKTETQRLFDEIKDKGVKSFSEMGGDMVKAMEKNFTLTPIMNASDKAYDKQIAGMMKMKEMNKLTREEDQRYQNMLAHRELDNNHFNFTQEKVDPTKEPKPPKPPKDPKPAKTDFDNAIESIRASTQALEIESRVFGLSEFAAAKLTKTLELQNAARKDAIGLTPSRVAMIDKESSAYARAVAAAEQLHEVQKRMDETRGLAKDIFSGIVNGARSGTSALDILGNALTKIQDKLLDMAENSLIDALFGKSGTSNAGGIGNFFSNFLTNLFGGAGGGVSGFYASGGPVTSGKSYMVGERGPERFTPSQSGMIAPNDNKPASIIFKPEIVIPPGYQARTENVSDGNGGNKPRVIVEQIGAELGGNQKARRSMGLAPLVRSYG